MIRVCRTRPASVISLLAGVFAIACTSTTPPVVDVAAPVAKASDPHRADGPAPPKVPAFSADADRLKRDVQALAVPREPGMPGWDDDRVFCEERLRSLGFEVADQRFVSFPPLQEVNVIGTKRGESKPGEEIILSAHYDHVFDCPGADDDASGLAAIFEVGRLLKERHFPRTLIVACWDVEEYGLLGSRNYASAAQDKGEDIRLAVALDAVGFVDRQPGAQHLPAGLTTVAPFLARKLEEREYRADFIALVHDPAATPFTDAFVRAADGIGLPLGDLEVSRLEQLVLNDVLRADHASFWLHGYPGVLLSDSGEFRNPAYHCGYANDTPDTLDYPFLAKVTSATAAMISDALDAKEAPAN